MLGRYAISDTLKIGSLCTGYGGLDMAVEAYFNAKTAWVSEIDKYACKVIDARINKPNIGDLKIVNWAEVEPVDIITAGYPCQPFSHAGLRKGVLDERHLWPYIKQAISTIRPSIVILENVRGHFKLGFREVLTDLTSIGYDVRWSIVRASDVGAPHRRERLFIVAEPADTDSDTQRHHYKGAAVRDMDLNKAVALLPTPTARHTTNHDEPIEDFLQRQANSSTGQIGMSTGVAIRLLPTPTGMNNRETGECRNWGADLTHGLKCGCKERRTHWI
jgi:DNA-cytosine methyltransferase